MTIFQVCSLSSLSAGSVSCKISFHHDLSFRKLFFIFLTQRTSFPNWFFRQSVCISRIVLTNSPKLTLACDLVILLSFSYCLGYCFHNSYCLITTNSASPVLFIVHIKIFLSYMSDLFLFLPEKKTFQCHFRDVG